MKPKEQHLIGVDTVPAIWAITYALVYDNHYAAPTATLREGVKRLLPLMQKRGLFTWYERLGVKLLTIRKG